MIFKHMVSIINRWSIVLNAAGRNPDDALYCNNCGASLANGPEEMPIRSGRTAVVRNVLGAADAGAIFWGIIVVLIGLWIIFEFGIRNISGLPSWVYDISWGWIFGVVIGLAVLVVGLRDNLQTI